MSPERPPTSIDAGGPNNTASGERWLAAIAAAAAATVMQTSWMDFIDA
jgi:hypothetical protein